MGGRHMEIWDLYDRKRNKIGKTHVRGVPIDEGFYHLVVHVWIQNEKGEVLLSKRDPNKSFGGLWECTGGSVLAGESSLEGAIREVEEEIGLQLDDRKGTFVFSKIASTHHSDYWLFPANPSLSDLQLQQGEVVDVMWANEEQYEKMVEQQLIVPTLPHFYKNAAILK